MFNPAANVRGAFIIPVPDHTAFPVLAAVMVIVCVLTSGPPVSVKFPLTASELVVTVKVEPSTDKFPTVADWDSVSVLVEYSMIFQFEVFAPLFNFMLL